MAQKLVLLVALCFLCDNQADASNSGWWNPLQWRDYWKVWWKDGSQAEEGQSGELLSSPEGPNVCTLKLPAGRTRLCHKVEGKSRLQCRTEQLYTYEYRCCPGFATKEGEVGCPQELYTSQETIEEVTRSLGLTQFLKFLKLSELESELSVDSLRFTLFVPNDEAFLALTEDTIAELLGDRKKLQNLVLFHVAPGKLVSQGFRDNQLIKTLNSPNRLRINVESDEIFVQGALVTTHNQGARNGVLHVIDRVLFPPSGDIKQILKADARLSIFSKLLRNSNINVANTTVFAPTDEAFDAMPRDRLDRLLGNQKCLERFLKNHMLKKPMYTSVLADHRLSTLEGHFCDFRVKNDSTLLVNDANVTNVDVTATDGVVHVIDKVLMPISAMDLIEAAQILNLTRLANLIKKTDLATTLQGDGPFTLFAPTDDAFDALPEAERRALQGNPARLREILQYHVTKGNQWTYMFGPDTLVPSLDGKSQLHLNSYRFGKVYSVDSACIVRANMETCNGVIHVIRKVLLPPKNTIYDLISSDPRFSTLLKLVNNTSLQETLRNRNASLTLFAPTDAAFDKILDRSILESVDDFPDELTSILKDHLVLKTLYTCGIHCKYSYWSLFSNRFSVFSLSRGVLRLHYRWNGQVFVNGIRLSEPDVSATNGVVHVIDRVLQLDQLGARRKAFQ